MPSELRARRRFLQRLACLSLGAGALPTLRTQAGAAPVRPPPPIGRPLRVATVCQTGGIQPSIAGNRDHVLALLDQACALRPDLVCLPETFTTVGQRRLPRAQKAETLSGPTIEGVARRARQHRCYVLCPIATHRDGRYFNSAVLVDRQGQIAGIYDKACPVTSAPDFVSLEDEISPGPAEIPVFDLDFGRLGIQTCFDAGFPENWSHLAKRGARLILWPSAYDGGRTLPTFATLHRVFVVTSVRNGVSRVIDPLGDVRATARADQPVVACDINLDFVVCHRDFNHDIPDRVRTRYGKRVLVQDTDPGSVHFLVEPRDSTLTCRHLQAELGFESSAEYHDRHRRAYARWRSQLPLEAQAPRHGRRPQHRKS